MRRNPGTDTDFRRSLPEFGCLSQGLPNGTGCLFVVSRKSVKHTRSGAHAHPRPGARYTLVMRARASFLFIAFLSASAQTPDWSQVNPEAMRHFQEIDRKSTRLNSSHLG